MGEINTNIKLKKKKYTFKLITFGCPVNQGESAAMETAMSNEGYTKTDGRADIYIINSCVVTSSAAAEARRVVRKIKREEPDAMVVLTGCYPQVYHAELVKELPELDIIIGTKGRFSLPGLISKQLDNGAGHPGLMIEEYGNHDRFEEMPTINQYRRIRPVVKIQEGCNEHCTYCIIRKARGRSRSMPVERVLEQVRGLLDAGHKEIILAGNQLGLYGLDLGDIDLSYIIEAVSRLPYNFRIRLSYVEPMNVTEKLLSTVAGNSKACKYLYLPVQSCSNRVLKRMGRRYRADDFAAIVKRAGELMPGVSIWTDLIAGFPGEENTDHNTTVSMMRELALSHLHVFPYSPRPGTAAVHLADNIPPDIKKERAAQLQELGRDLVYTYNRTQVGKQLRVLVERVIEGNDGRRYAEGYAGNHVLVRIPWDFLATGNMEVTNRFITVRVVKALPRWVEGVRFRLEHL